VTAPLVFAEVPLSARYPAPLDLEVAEHQTVALLGEEDSGLGALGGYALGLEQPATGSVRVFGTVIADLPERPRLAFRHRVGYLPAGDGLLQNLSLRDNVALPLRFGSDASVREIEGRVNVLLAAVRLISVAGVRPNRANEEERRRAALARAVAFDPALLILEQPFDGLTARAAAELLELARGGETAQGARRTILITGQELPVALHRRMDHIYRLTRAGVLQPDTV
jgi:ABC-type transporter Mla maintaining outer membrane lipid asymmetry ATPase subunit MlaF